MTLVYLPHEREFFAEKSPASEAVFRSAGEPDTLELVIPPGRRALVAGRRLPLLKAVTRLVALTPNPLRPASIEAYALLSKLALELVARERVAPVLLPDGEDFEARWAVSLVDPDDIARFGALAAVVPPAAHALPVDGASESEVWAPEIVLRAFLDATADALMRGTPPPVSELAPLETRWVAALTGPDPRLKIHNYAEHSLALGFARFAAPVLGAREALRACFRFELAERSGAPFRLVFELQAMEDPSFRIAARELWAGALAETRARYRNPEDTLLSGLGRAARIFPPIGRTLDEPRPTAIELDADEAGAFLCGAAERLARAGFGLVVPRGLAKDGGQRLRLKMRIQSRDRERNESGLPSQLGMSALLEFRYEAAIGDRTVDWAEIEALAGNKPTLVEHEGEWVLLDPAELAAMRAQLGQHGTLSQAEALSLALDEDRAPFGLPIEVDPRGAFGERLNRLRGAQNRELEPPDNFLATLRPYQARGFAWLATLGELGLGGCLADDMGLGKTVQTLAYLMHRRREKPGDRRPILLVAPTSVVGNWEREIQRFAPELPIERHYGLARSAEQSDFSGKIVLTTYGVLRRDRALLGQIEWAVAVLDEAQNIKNPTSATAKVARALKAECRLALTGTPLENRLSDLWSIFDFALPGFFGPLETFRRNFAFPIERHGDRALAARLSRRLAPFLLRRSKRDPAVISDLPDKIETKEFCTLTAEQVQLYQSVLGDELDKVRSTAGMVRRGRVLTLLSYLKQVCNHPAQFFGQKGPLAGRSGKLMRLVEMLEEVLAEGEKALVFTQFREMGALLERHLADTLGTEVAFLHGQSSRRARDEMVEQFQKKDAGPQIFVLSLKAGGTGLNLTAASHVFHYDRWWNPAVEDQATDRAYRIGQEKNVQVHKLFCQGTIEEKIDGLLETKRDLAARVVTGGEHWITELDDQALADLFALSNSALEAEPTERGQNGGLGEARP